MQHPAYKISDTIDEMIIITYHNMQMRKDGIHSIKKTQTTPHTQNDIISQKMIYHSHLEITLPFNPTQSRWLMHHAKPHPR